MHTKFESNSAYNMYICRNILKHYLTLQKFFDVTVLFYERE